MGDWLEEEEEKKNTWELLSQLKGTVGGGEVLIEKINKTRNTSGSAEEYQGCSIVGD